MDSETEYDRIRRELAGPDQARHREEGERRLRAVLRQAAEEGGWPTGATVTQDQAVELLARGLAAIEREAPGTLAGLERYIHE